MEDGSSLESSLLATENPETTLGEEEVETLTVSNISPYPFSAEIVPEFSKDLLLSRTGNLISHRLYCRNRCI